MMTWCLLLGSDGVSMAAVNVNEIVAAGDQSMNFGADMAVKICQRSGIKGIGIVDIDMFAWMAVTKLPRRWKLGDDSSKLTSGDDMVESWML
ncbi:hypothetical protein F0562_000048 [Nyssa sinensis]|uniref:Uncharacterized protein n=1 Tax=Nyssa sinensis TaxID=561372 RepID=A0A5J5C0E9_9ASTE|nr:hypothetical protein F0562_000048 [Nyssa sinensis]